MDLVIKVIKKMEILLLALTFFLGSLSLVFKGPVPGDIELSVFLQILFSGHTSWAHFVTSLTKLPNILVPLTICALVIWRFEKKKGLLVLGFSMLIIKLLDLLLRKMIYVPKPDSQLVYVAVESGSSGLPSSFALIWGVITASLFFSLREQAGKIKTFGTLGVLSLLIAGTLSRVILGGHWPSQMLASLSLSFVVTASLRSILQLKI